MTCTRRLRIGLLAACLLTGAAGGAPFRRADSNLDGRMDLGDGIFTLNYLFAFKPAKGCDDAMDANDSGIVDLADAIFTFNYLFAGGREPPPPFPDCGPDPTPDAVTCAAHPSCAGTTLESIKVRPGTIVFTALGATRALSVTGRYSDGSSKDLTAADTGTTYEAAPAGVVSVSADGVVTSQANGEARITVRNGVAAAEVFVLVSDEAPPPRTEVSGFICGAVFDTEAEAPLAGARVSAAGLDGVVFSDADGRFRFPTPGTGTFFITVEKEGYTYGQRSAAVESTRPAAVETVYLKPLDAAETEIGPAGGDHTSADGEVELAFPPGATNDPIRVRATNLDYQEELPAPLPDMTDFTYCVRLHPELAEFEKPVTVRVRNSLGFPAGTRIPVGIYRKDEGLWKHLTLAVVSADGAWAEFETTHFSVCDINFYQRRQERNTDAPTLSELFGLTGQKVNQPGWKCKSIQGGSRVDVRDGEVGLSHSLPTYRSLEQMRGVTLEYSSRSARPTAFIGFDYDFQPNPGKLPVVGHTVSVRVGGISESFRLAAGEGVARLGYLWQPETAGEARSRTGIYPYRMDVSNDYAVSYWISMEFAGLVVEDTGIPGRQLARRITSLPGQVVLRNLADSPFGAGWNVKGLQRLVREPDGSAMILEGAAGTAAFEGGLVTSTLTRPDGTDDFGSDGITFPLGIAFDPWGNIIATDMGHTVWRIDPAGNATRIAGNGTPATSGDGGLAVNARVNTPHGVCVDGAGTIYFAEIAGNRVRRIDTNGIITTVAGSGQQDFGGDGGPATDARLNGPMDVAIDDQGNLYIADARNARIRQVDPEGIITTFAGGGGNTMGEGPATEENINAPTGVAVDGKGNVYIACQTFVKCVKMVDPEGIIRLVTPYIASGILDVTVAPSGDVYYHAFQGGGGNWLERLDTEGTRAVVMGQGDQPAGPGLPAKDIMAPGFFHVTTDSNGRVCFFGRGPSRVFRLVPSSSIAGLEAPGADGEFTTLRFEGDGTATRSYSSGTTVEFDAAGLQTAVEDRNGNRTTFEWEGDGDDRRLVRIVDPIGLTTTLTYDAAGRIESITDPANRTTRLLVDAAGDLIQIENPDGGVRRFAYDEEHLVEERVEPMGQTTRYGFDGHGALRRVTLPDGTERTFRSTFSAPLLNDLVEGRRPWQARPERIGADETVEEAVDASGNAYTYETNAFGTRTLIRNPLGKETRFVRDGDNLPTRIELPGGGVIENEYDAEGRLKKYTSPEGAATIIGYGPKDTIRMIRNGKNVLHNFSYDTRGNLTEAIFGNMSRNQMRFRCEFDDRGLRTSIRDYLNNTTRFTHDPRGLVSEIRDPLDRTASMEYDEAGQPVLVRDAAGNEWRTEYDAMGRITATRDPLGNETRFTFDLSGRATSVRSPGGGETRYEFDAMDRITRIIDAEGNEARMAYNAEGLSVRVDRPDGSVTTYEYNAVQQPARVIHWAGVPGPEPGPDDAVIEYEYDDRGDLVAITDPAGFRSAFERDWSGRIIRRIDPEGNAGEYTYNEVGELVAVRDVRGLTVAMEYNELGFLTKLSDDLGLLEERKYDRGGRLQEVRDAAGNAERFQYNKAGEMTVRLDALNRRTEYFHDVRGLLERVVDPAGRTVIQTEYDAAGRAVAVLDGLGNRREFEFDGEGNIRAFLDAPGNRTEYERDRLGRVRRITYADGSFETFAYDPLGRLAEHRLPDGRTVRRTYDVFGRLEAIDGPGDDDATITYWPHGLVRSATNRTSAVELDYDALGRVVSRREDGLEIAMAYDTAGGTEEMTYPSGLRVRHTFDLRGRLAEVQVDGVPAFSWTYDELNRPIRRDAANGVATTYAWSVRGELLEIRHGGAAAPVWQAEFTYDAMGLPVAARDLVYPEQSWRYEMDGAMRLTGAQRGVMDAWGMIPAPLEDLGFGYDAVTNLIERREGAATTAFTHDALHRLLSAGAETFEHDDAGSLVGDAENTYEYDVRGRLVRAARRSDGQEILRIGYNAFGDRVRTVTPDGEIRHVVAGGATIEERTAAGEVARRLVYGLNFQEPLLLLAPGGPYTVHQGAMASVVALTAADGSLAERYAYAPYGEVSRFDGSGAPIAASGAGNPLYFNAQRLDPIGWYHFRFRSYAPRLGRFVSRDPAGYAAGASLYPYALGNPIAISDPNGDFVPAVILLGGLIGANVKLWMYNIEKACGNPLDPASYNPQDFDGSEQLRQGGAGFFGGAMGTWAFGAAATYLAGSVGWGALSTYATAGGLSGIATQGAEDLYLNEESSLEEYVQAGGLGAGLGILGEFAGRIGVGLKLLNNVEGISPKAAAALSKRFTNPNVEEGLISSRVKPNQAIWNIQRNRTIPGTTNAGGGLSNDLDMSIRLTGDRLMTRAESMAEAFEINRDIGVALVDPGHGVMNSIVPEYVQVFQIMRKNGKPFLQRVYGPITTEEVFGGGKAIYDTALSKFKPVLNRAQLKITNPVPAASAAVSVTTAGGE